jgi:hypothetical protein
MRPYREPALMNSSACRPFSSIHVIFIVLIRPPIETLSVQGQGMSSWLQAVALLVGRLLCTCRQSDNGCSRCCKSQQDSGGPFNTPQWPRVGLKAREETGFSGLQLRAINEKSSCKSLSDVLCGCCATVLAFRPIGNHGFSKG